MKVTAGVTTAMTVVGGMLVETRATTGVIIGGTATCSTTVVEVDAAMTEIGVVWTEAIVAAIATT